MRRDVNFYGGALLLGIAVMIVGLLLVLAALGAVLLDGLGLDSGQAFLLGAAALAFGSLSGYAGMRWLKE